MKRCYPLVLTALLLFVLLAGCGSVPAEIAPPSTAPVETTLPPTTAPSETTEPIPVVDFGPDFPSMDLVQVQEWFYDFAREYALDYLPTLDPEYGPLDSAGTYVYWIYARYEDSFTGAYAEISREFLEQEVLTHFGIIPTEYRGDPHSWAYDEEREVFSQCNLGMPDSVHYMLTDMEYADGIYTVQATKYTPRGGYTAEEYEDQIKGELFEGSRLNVIDTANIILSFRLDPETQEPLFLAHDRVRRGDFPKP